MDIRARVWYNSGMMKAFVALKKFLADLEEEHGALRKEEEALIETAVAEIARDTLNDQGASK